MKADSTMTTNSVLGRTLITEKALNSLVAGVAATMLHVPVKKVQVKISDKDGLLALTVRAAIGQQHGAPLLEQAEAARQQMCKKVTELSGRAVGDCLLELDGMQNLKRRRVL